MEFIKTLLEKHTNEDGALDLDAAMAAINKDFPLNAVPKDVFNTTSQELKDTKELVDTLKTENGTVAELKAKIDTFENENKTLKETQAKERKEYAVKEALQNEGVADIDYITYKLGEIDTDKDGKLVGFDDKLKSLKAEFPTFFGSETDETKEKKDTKGYKPIDNKLDQGNPPDPANAVAKAFSDSLGL